jgi:hypothetical protein
VFALECKVLHQLIKDDASTSKSIFARRIISEAEIYS